MAMGTAAAEARVFASGVGAHLFLADGSRIFDLDPAYAETLAQELDRGDVPPEIADLIGGRGARYVGDEPVPPPPVKTLSLNVAQACNMSCSYCYADEGRFGGRARSMGDPVARQAIDWMVANAPAGSDLLVGFMGGEPFVNRRLVHAATRYADAAARQAGHRVRFSLTTNATLVRDEDAALLREFPFAVSVSLDGDRSSNDRQRRLVSSRASAYDAALAGLERLVANGRPRLLTVRSTVTPLTGRLPDLLGHLLSLGADEAGFAPVIAAPAGAAAFTTAQMDDFLGEMIACGTIAKQKILANEPWPFSNFHTAMQQIHRGAHMPFPCAAGAGYLSVSAEGGLYGCHRVVDDPRFSFGTLSEGDDAAARAAHLERSHVDRQDPCRSCWARYLCGGGCHHEVAQRGRIGCDYIRGWLEFCLSAYAELRHLAPRYFDKKISADQGMSDV